MSRDIDFINTSPEVLPWLKNDQKLGDQVPLKKAFLMTRISRFVPLGAWGTLGRTGFTEIARQ